MSETKDLTPGIALDPLMQPTNEYAMRNAANILAEYARRSRLTLSAEDELDLNFAYQQLHRGANTLRATVNAATFRNS